MFCTPVCKQDYSWRPVGCLCIPQFREKSFKKFQWLFNAWQARAAAGLCMRRQQENRSSNPLFLLVFLIHGEWPEAGRTDVRLPRQGQAAVRRTVFWQRTIRNRTGSAEHGHAAGGENGAKKPIGPADPVGRCFPQPGPPEVANCGAVSRSAGLSARPGAEG